MTFDKRPQQPTKCTLVFDFSSPIFACFLPCLSVLLCNMAEEKPFTIPELVTALKEAGFATKDDVKEIVLEAVDAVLEGQTPIYERLDGIDKRLDKLEEGQARLEVAQAHTTDEIKGLKADLSDSPSRAELNNLKARVTGLEKTH
jgi:hypothetical protein